jgi:hypothetical protein
VATEPHGPGRRYHHDRRNRWGPPTPANRNALVRSQPSKRTPPGPGSTQVATTTGEPHPHPHATCISYWARPNVGLAVVGPFAPPPNCGMPVASPREQISGSARREFSLARIRWITSQSLRIVLAERPW